MTGYKQLFIQFDTKDGLSEEVFLTSTSDTHMFVPEVEIKKLFEHHNASKVIAIYEPEKCIVCGDGTNYTAREIDSGSKWLAKLNEKFGDSNQD